MNVFVYSDTVMNHFRNPRNVGEMPGADGVGECANAACGDLTRIYIKVDNGRISDVKFQTFGCPAAVASASMLTEMVKGVSVADARRLRKEEVADALGGLTPEKMACSNLAADALRRAIDACEQQA